MKLSCLRIVLPGLVLGGATSVFAKTIASDLSAPEKRRSFVEQASRLAKPAKPAPLPADLALPFSPPGFELSDAQERAAAPGTTSQSAPIQKTATDRETLEQIASRVVPSGSIRDKNGEPMLTFGKNTFKKGTNFKVTFNSQDYDLELIRIDSTTFTLRLNREEITRPIKPAK
jgi:hypothetical protein